MRQIIELKNTGKRGFNGQDIFEASIGPYKYITTMDDLILIGGKFESLEVLAWCSKDGEPTCPIDSNKYDVRAV